MRPLTPAQRTALGMLAVSGRWFRPLPGMEAAYQQLVDLELAAAAHAPGDQLVYCLTVSGARIARQLPARPAVIDLGSTL